MAAPDSFSHMVDSSGQPLSKMPDSILPSTNGVVFNSRGEVLLQKRADNGYWGLPGGRGTSASRWSRVPSARCWKRRVSTSRSSV